jgi:uncharacterized protein YjiS (DUF1127 family)
MLPIQLLSKACLQIKGWREVSQQRNEIRGLSEHLLKDINLSSVDANYKVNRPFCDTTEKSDSSLRHLGRNEIASQVNTCIICRCVKH